MRRWAGDARPPLRGWTFAGNDSKNAFKDTKVGMVVSGPEPHF